MAELKTINVHVDLKATTSAYLNIDVPANLQGDALRQYLNSYFPKHIDILRDEMCPFDNEDFEIEGFEVYKE